MSDELNVWREACEVQNETFYAVVDTFQNDPEARQASAFALKAAAAVIRDYGDKRYQQAIADVVEWLDGGDAFAMTDFEVSSEITRRFGPENNA